MVVQLACRLRTDLPSEASPPGPLSVTGEGENSKKDRCVSPPLPSGRGGRGIGANLEAKTRQKRPVTATLPRGRSQGTVSVPRLKLAPMGGRGVRLRRAGPG